MKEFVIYTGLRVLLFFACLGIVLGVWMLATGSVPLLWAVVIAFALSGIASYFLLNRQRDAFAHRVELRAHAVQLRADVEPRAAFAARVEQRAARATSAFDERRAREDAANDAKGNE